MNLHGGTSAWVEVNLGAIGRNIDRLLERSSSQTVLVDVSADAYGHGVDRVLEVARRFGVSGAGREALACGSGPRAETGLYGFRRDDSSEPTIRVTARVLNLKTVLAGEGVSYGFTYRAERLTNLALVGIGYGHGLDRSAGNRMSITLAGKPRKIAGRVAMNVVMVELGDDVAAIGDEAVLFGDPAYGEPSIVDWADGLGVEAPEVAATFGVHLPKVYR